MLPILMYDTAARIGELAALTLEDVRMDEPARITITGKRGKTRIVPMGERTRRHLTSYLDEFHPDTDGSDGARPLFHSTRNGTIRPLSVDRIDEILKTAASKARGTCPSMPGHIHCRLIRRTRAMDLYQQGVPLPTVMKLLGHESMSTTSAFYAFATLDMMRKAVDAADPGPDPPRRHGSANNGSDSSAPSNSQKTLNRETTRNAALPPQSRTVSRLNNKPGLITVKPISV